MSDHPNVEAAMNGQEQGNGRPSEYTPEKLDIICKAIARGLPDKYVAAEADICEATLENWKKIPQFLESIKKAEAKRLGERLDRISEGVNGWQGTAWFVERKYREDFKPPTQSNENTNKYDPKNAKEIFNAWKDSGAPLNG